MKFYCGIDLSARDFHVCLINEQLQVMVQQKLRNELAKICQLLEPHKADLKIVVESTFNWYRMAPGGHYREVFSIDRPPLLAVRRRGSVGHVPDEKCTRRHI